MLFDLACAYPNVIELKIADLSNYGNGKDTGF